MMFLEHAFLLHLILMQFYFTTGNKCVEKTCLINENDMKFIVFGDWGGGNTYPYSTIILEQFAHGLNKISEKENASFFISVGDQFYPNGVENVSDTRFQSFFEKVFDKPGHQRLWHLIAGNHDYNKNVIAQEDYTKYSWRWNFPSLYYSISYQTRSGVTVEFLMIDTIILCGNNKARPDQQPPGPSDPKLAEEQWQWIERKLNSSKAKYVFIAGHYPVRSTGFHGPKTYCFYKRMEALMSKYHVTAYFGGHEHSLEHYRHTTPTGYVLDNVISGFGSRYHVERTFAGNGKKESLFFYPDESSSNIFKETDKGGFVLAKLTSTVGTFEYYNGDAIFLYSFTVSPRS